MEKFGLDEDGKPNPEAWWFEALWASV